MTWYMSKCQVATLWVIIKICKMAYQKEAIIYVRELKLAYSFKPEKRIGTIAEHWLDCIYVWSLQEKEGILHLAKLTSWHTYTYTTPISWPHHLICLQLTQNCASKRDCDVRLELLLTSCKLLAALNKRHLQRQTFVWYVEHLCIPYSSAVIMRNEGGNWNLPSSCMRKEEGNRNFHI